MLYRLVVVIKGLGIIHISGRALQFAIYAAIPAFIDGAGFKNQLPVPIINPEKLQLADAGQNWFDDVVFTIAIWRKRTGHKYGREGLKNFDRNIGTSGAALHRACSKRVGNAEGTV